METIENINWLGNAGFYFVDKDSGNTIYYVDPFKLTQANLPKANLLFITHAHPDHLSPEDIEKVASDTTIVIAPKSCISQIPVDTYRQVPVEPNKEYTVKNFAFQTVPAYNTKPDRLQFHPRENQWVGYVFVINGKKIYHAGDTDFIPEMSDFEQLHFDIAMLPIGGTYTMDVQEAIEAANAIQAKITVPIHYKRQLGGNYEDAEKAFSKGVTNSQVVILNQLQ